MSIKGFVDLNRRFVHADRCDPDESQDYARELGLIDGTLGWEDLLKRRRVVLLAEGGAGKTRELEHQAQQRRVAGEFAFFATLQNVARVGLETALQASLQQLKAWRGSSQPAYFFLDSIDEAKSAQIRLREALESISRGIQGAEVRAHVVVTGRLSDWEARADLLQLEQVLPLPAEDLALAPIEGRALIAQMVRHEKTPPSPPAEVPLIVRLNELDKPRIRKFAESQEVQDVEDFLVAIEQADLWRFARRPLDLGWLIDEWRQRKAFEPLATMLERSLRYRLRETDQHRGRQHTLDEQKGFEALERIGAALVLQKLEYIEVPDSTLDLTEQRRGVRLSEVLHEWPERDRVLLINRAVFDPLVSGLVRLHNDNRGEVRGFLAARWFKRLLSANRSYGSISDLLFRSTYEVELIVPSLRQTVAWLSIWDERIAREALRRDPSLLMNAGDPGSLSFTTRASILRRVAAGTRGRRHFEYASADHLKRLVHEDLAPLMRELSEQLEDSVAGRMMLFLLIELGHLESCADLAVRAAHRRWRDPFTAVFSGRALMTVGSGADRRCYAQHVIDRVDVLDPTVVWDAVEQLFPQEMSVAELIGILTKLNLTSDEHWRFDSLFKTLPARLTDLTQLEEIARLFIDRATREQAQSLRDHKQPFHRALETLSLRMYELLGWGKTSQVALQAVCTVMHREAYRKRNEALYAAAMASAPRRRALLWVARESYRGSDLLPLEYAHELWHFRVLGLPFALQVEDIEWLLQDARARPSAEERALAADAILWLQQQHSLGETVVEQLRAAGADNPAVQEFLAARLASREPTEEEIRRDQRSQEVDARNAIQLAESESSWIKLADRVRADPERFRRLPPPSSESMDADLYHVAELLFALGENRNRYAISSLNRLAPLFDATVRSALEEGFMRFWKCWKPTLLSERAAAERNCINTFDRIGLIGVSLEAARGAHWAKPLSHQEAVRAAGYATLELNGFPSWLTALAQDQPAAVREALVQELSIELALPADTHPDTLGDIATASKDVKSLVASFLLQQLTQGMALSKPVLRRVLEVLIQGGADRVVLAGYLEGQLKGLGLTDPDFPMFLAALLRVSAHPAELALREGLRKLTRADKTRAVLRMLPALTHDADTDAPDMLSQLPFAILLDLARMAYRRLPGKASAAASELDRDGHINEARSTLFKTIATTPGRATYEALQRFQRDRTVTLKADRMSELAFERAAADSEMPAWSSEEVVRFEDDALMVPRNAADLQRTVSNRLRDLQHDLLHGDFRQGPELARTTTEEEVQNLVARELRAREGRSYSLEREPHVAEEKKPDVRFHATASEASVPMEIKVAETWAFTELVVALNTQLIGQYLRAREDRHGILLIVHQRPRPQGWRHTSGQWLGFPQLIEELRALARQIAGRSPQAPQVSIEVLDVSSVTLRGTTKKTKPKPKSKPKPKPKAKTKQRTPNTRRESLRRNSTGISRKRNA
jgi:hypothetical protein